MTELKTVQPRTHPGHAGHGWFRPWSLGSPVVVGLAVVPAWDRGPASPQEVADAYMEARQDLGSNHRPVRLRRHGVGG